MTRPAVLFVSTALAGLPALAADFGAGRDAALAAASADLFGIAAPLAASAPATDAAIRRDGDTAADQIALAGGLAASFLTRSAADRTDMMAFFPAADPTHLISCVEGDREEIAAGKLNPSVQAIALTDGSVTTLLRGLSGCDGIRTTPWGTILATEEEDDGGAWEILDPLALENVVVSDRATGAVSDPAHVARRKALPTMAWEGIAITAEGVVFAGDEERPGSAGPDADGGAIFKFVPAVAHAGGAITALDASPLVAGQSHAMQVSCYGDRLQAGQGCEVGKAAWLPVDPARARADAAAKGATGYYRPEDMDIDPAFTGPGLRFCWTNTGNEEAGHFAEVMCGIDSQPMAAPAADGEGKIAFTTRISRFLTGDADFNSFDNLAFQPGTANLYVIEDHPNGDVWACLPDGADRDLTSDGCIRALSVRDSAAEPTGFIFAADGLSAYVSVQHSADDHMAPVDDYATDDVIRVTGFTRPSN